VRGPPFLGDAIGAVGVAHAMLAATPGEAKRRIVGQYPLRLDQLRRPEQPDGTRGHAAATEQCLFGPQGGGGECRGSGGGATGAGRRTRWNRPPPPDRLRPRGRRESRAAATFGIFLTVFFADWNVDRGAFWDVALARLEAGERVEAEAVAEAIEQRSNVVSG